MGRLCGPCSKAMQRPCQAGSCADDYIFEREGDANMGIDGSVAKIDVNAPPLTLQDCSMTRQRRERG
jgi:hypothetical protein